MPESLRQQLSDFSHKLSLLPGAEEPPKSTLHILGNAHREDVWQRLLFYFLSPGESHGLDAALLEHLLTSLSEREDLELPFSYFDIENIRVETEVTLSNGRADALIWLSDAWFICWELKVYSSEAGQQTETYAQANLFESIDRQKSEFERPHYLYLAPENASPPSSDEFVEISWQWVSAELQSFLQDGYGQYPARTTAQLEDFTATINRELTMTEHQEHEREKAKLYLEYYDDISAARQSFDNRWDEFFDNWGLQLAQKLDMVDIIENPDIPDDFVVVDCEIRPGEVERWVFEQGNAQWAGIRKHDWRRAKDDLSSKYQSAEDREDIRIALHHRPELNRDLAIQEHTLELQCWHGTGHDEGYNAAFRDRLHSKIEETDSTLPSSISVQGSSEGNPFNARYDIPVGEHEDFFDAYVAALNNAFHDLVIDHRNFVTIFDETLEETIEEFR